MKGTARPRLEWLLVAPWRLALLVALTLAVPVLLLNESAVRLSEERFAEERRTETVAAAERAAGLVDDWILSLRQRIAGAVEVPDLKSAARSKDVASLTNLLLLEIGRVLPSGARERDVVRLTVLDEDGRVVYGAVPPAIPGEDLSARDFFERVAGRTTAIGAVTAQDVLVTDLGTGPSAAASGGGSESGAVSGLAAPSPDRILLVAPIKFGLDPFVGVLIAEVDRRSVAPFLASARGDARDIYLIDRAGQLISRAGDPGDARDLSGFDPTAAALAGALGVSEGADPIDGAAALVATARVPETGWITLAVRTPTEADIAADATLQQQRFVGGSLALILVVASVLIGTATSRSIRRRDALSQSLDQQTAVSEVLKTISRSAFQLQPVLDTVLENAARLSSADMAWMARADNDGVLYAVAGFGMGSENYRTPFRNPSPERRRAQVLFRCIDERRTVVVVDVTADPDFRTSGAAKTGARSLVAVPMIRDGAAIGGFVVARRDVRAFTDNEIQLVETFADQAAIAIENVRLFNEIQEQSTQLADASRHKSEFLANMSHELRTPLNAIIGFSDVLLEGMGGQIGERAREYLGDIRSSGQHLLSLINDVLDLSKVEAGRMELELGEVSVGVVIDDALLLVRERAAAHGITVAAEFSPDLPPLTADARKLKQALVNLVTNAVKFTPDGGWVGVTARREADDVVIAVRDTGVGISPDDQARIFEEFRQAKRRDGSVEGTGLGLALTKRIVELHGGRISLESEIGKGSTFTVRLPLRQVVATA